VRGEAVLSRTPFGGWAETGDGGEAVAPGPADDAANPSDLEVPSSEIRSFLVADQSAAPRWIVWINGVPEFTGPEFVARQFYEAALKKATTKSALIQEERR